MSSDFLINVGIVIAGGILIAAIFGSISSRAAASILKSLLYLSSLVLLGWGGWNLMVVGRLQGWSGQIVAFSILSFAAIGALAVRALMGRDS